MRPFLNALCMRLQCLTFSTQSECSSPIRLTTASVDNDTLILNYCILISSALRRSTRWPTSGVAAILSGGDIFGKALSSDDDTTAMSLALSDGVHMGLSLSSPANHSRDDNPIFSSFLQLEAILVEKKHGAQDLDFLTILLPFLLTVKLALTNGSITLLALEAISKFFSYGLVTLQTKDINTLCVLVISALTHCRFEAADQNSDDAVSFKVLRLLETLMTSDFLECIPNSSVTEVVQTCLLVTCNKKRSEVLRRAAEMVLRNITELLFAKVIDFPLDIVQHDDLPINFDNTTLPRDTIGGESTPGLNTSTPEDTDDLTPALANSEKPRESATPAVSSSSDPDERFGVASIHEYLGMLVSIISPSNQHQHMESTRVFALTLISTSFEVAGLVIPQHQCLFSLVLDPISKHVLQILTTTDSPVLLRAALQVFTTMLIVMSHHLKSQLELSITLALNSILPESTSRANDTIKGTNVVSRTPLAKEMIMELFSLLWMRSPLFFTRMFIDYDCQFERSDLAIKLFEVLCNLSLADSASRISDAVPPMCLDSILSFVSGVNARTRLLNPETAYDTPQLLQDKAKKNSFTRCMDLLNNDPKKGIAALVENGFINDPSNTNELANFFFNKSGRLNKKVLGEFLAKPSNKSLLEAFIDFFEFESLRVDEALRIMLKTFRLPGESQQIERVVELFAKRYVACQSAIDLTEAISTQEVVRPDQDAVFVLSYSIIMLNTDLHNPQVKKQMLLDEYRRNLRGIYNGKDFPEWYLSKIYHSIKDREIIMPEEHHGTDKWFDDLWHNLVSSQALLRNAQPSFDFSMTQICQFDRALFETVIDTMIATYVKVFESSNDDHVISRLMSSIDKCVNICLVHNMNESVNKLVNLLCDLTMLTRTSPPPTDATEETADSIPLTQIRIENRTDPITIGETAVWFGRDFKAQLSLVVLFRLLKKNDYRVQPLWALVIRVILILFENCMLEPNLFRDFQSKIQMDPIPKVSPRYIITKVKPMTSSGLLSSFSSFLRSYSDEPPEPTDQEIESTLSTIDCVHLVNIPSVFEGVSKSDPQNLAAFVRIFLNMTPVYSDTTKRFYESEVIFIAEVAVCFCLLLNDSALVSEVYDKLVFSHLSKKNSLRISTYRLLLARKSAVLVESLKQTVQDVHAVDREVLALHGSQLIQPLLSLVDNESSFCETLLSNDIFWKVLRLFAANEPNARVILKFMESLIRDNPQAIKQCNYVLVLALLDEVSSVGAIVSQYEQESEKTKFSEKDTALHRNLLQLSQDSIAVTAQLSTVPFYREAQGGDGSFPLIQALAHQCFNPCRGIRAGALKTLKSLVNAMDFESGGSDPLGVFESGLFPLLAEIFKAEVISTDPTGFDETQLEVLSFVSKMFLKCMNSLPKTEVEKIWMIILDYFVLFLENSQASAEKALACIEFAPEVIKNMVLVLHGAGVLLPKEHNVWHKTLNKVGKLYPNLKDLLLELEGVELEGVESAEPQIVTVKEDESLNEQQLNSDPVSSVDAVGFAETNLSTEIIPTAEI